MLNNEPVVKNLVLCDECIENIISYAKITHLTSGDAFRSKGFVLIAREKR